MDKNIIQQAQRLAEKVIVEAGSIIRDRFDSITEVNQKGHFGDVVTEIDYLAEEIIVKAIQNEFPTHQIRSEEIGILGEENDGFG